MAIRIDLSHWVLAAFIVVQLAACGGPERAQSVSSVSTVNIQHSAVKLQNIGNCWIYSALGVVESLNIRAGWKEIDFSESYLTYRHFQDLLLDDELDAELGTGGNFQLAMSLIDRYGVMKEGVFIPEEANELGSKRQEEALAILNESLKNGDLAALRTRTLTGATRRAIVTRELDRAFSVNMASLSGKIIKAEEINLGRGRDGNPLTLARLARDSAEVWQTVSFPANGTPQPVPNAVALRSAEQNSILYRVKRALNDGYPVLITWFIDFNALKGDGFDLRTLAAANGPGAQGSHVTLLEDYVASGVDPATQRPFHVGEDTVSAREKSLALNYGNIDYFIVKNSWGQKSDSSYFRDGSFGYHKLMANYLFGWIPQANDDGTQSNISSFGVDGFVLPPGY